MDRRNFLKAGCSVCVAAAGMGALATLLSSCSRLPVYKTTGSSMLTVPASSFGEGKLLVVRAPGLDFDVLLVKKADNNYTALLMKCTHQDNPLTATSSGLFCPSHGSSFDLEGRVTKEPALAPLRKYNTTITDNNITIHLKP